MTGDAAAAAAAAAGELEEFSTAAPPAGGAAAQQSGPIPVRMCVHWCAADWVSMCPRVRTKNNTTMHFQCFDYIFCDCLLFLIMRPYESKND